MTGATLRPGRLYVGADDGRAVACPDLAFWLRALTAAVRDVDTARSVDEHADRVATLVAVARTVTGTWGDHDPA